MAILLQHPVYCGCHIVNMKLIILVCLAAVAAAAPRPQERPVAILRDDRHDDGAGNFNYAFESEDGTSVSAAGAPGAAGQSNIQGSYRFTLPDGTIAEVTYIADENGFQPSSDLLPVPHPLPAHAIEQIRTAEQQRAAGEVFEK
ncbi:cuticle protein AM1199-like [Penaeus japonicus]|uniref:cuticle protein AM1199-like n=1 Tax=Penaeus japonicus TaxID=27405 RepID=UPI001C710AAF|nr:cuticle protein AM1199-like [Penaeus japonicus]